MEQEKVGRLRDIRSGIMREFDLSNIAEFKSSSRTASAAKKSFILLARLDGFTNPEIAGFIGSSRKSVSNSFSQATQLQQTDGEFARDTRLAAESLDIDLSKS